MDNFIILDGVRYAKDNLEELTSQDKNGNEFYQAIHDFLTEWWSDSDTMFVHTSGSTGTPKDMAIEKKKMMASAATTLSFLDIRQGDSALLCMSLDYIAGKMMMVRALSGELNLITSPPSGHPLRNLTIAPTFAAMIPLQVYNSLQNDTEKKILKGIRHLIIGGGPIDNNLETELERFPHNVWSTYGMTETLSHIALRKLNGKDRSDWYTPLDGVTVSLSPERTLVIDAPLVCKSILKTNDIAEISAGHQFRILGRLDNTINSGGIKIQIEQVEALLKPSMPCPFLITSKPDEKFGEIVVLLAESKGQDISNIKEICVQTLPHYWQPKEIILADALPYTGSGKPDRSMAKKIALNYD